MTFEDDAELRETYLAPIAEWFGFPDELFDDFALFRANVKTVNMVNRDIEPSVDLEPIQVGLPFVRVNMRYPKLVTPSVLLWGKHATRHVISVDRERCDAFFRRETIELSGEELASCTELGGYVILHCEGLCIGLGLLERGDGRSRRVESLHPKAWKLREGQSAFGGDS